MELDDKPIPQVAATLTEIDSAPTFEVGAAVSPLYHWGISRLAMIVDDDEDEVTGDMV